MLMSKNVNNDVSKDSPILKGFRVRFPLRVQSLNSSEAPLKYRAIYKFDLSILASLIRYVICSEDKFSALERDQAIGLGKLVTSYTSNAANECMHAKTQSSTRTANSHYGL